MENMHKRIPKTFPALHYVRHADPLEAMLSKLLRCNIKEVLAVLRDFEAADSQMFSLRLLLRIVDRIQVISGSHVNAQFEPFLEVPFRLNRAHRHSIGSV